MLRIIFIFIFLFFPLLAAKAEELPKRGHAVVTSPQNCAALMEDEEGAVPAIHYMTHAYKRCIERSRKIMRVDQKDKPENDTREINQNNVSYSNDEAAHNNYYRVTPRHKEEDNDE